MIVRNGYIVKKAVKGRREEFRRFKVESERYRDWWLVKHHSDNHHTGQVFIGHLNLPPWYVGKRVRFKVEVLEDVEEEVLEQVL